MDEREEETVFSIWVDWENRVISFSEENGFEELRFPTHEEKFKFAIDRGNEELESSDYLKRGVIYEIRI